MNTKRIVHSAVIIALAVSIHTEADARIWLPQILGDHMVLQQQSDVNLWGKSLPSSKVSVTVSWSDDKYFTVSDKNGNWKLSVATPKGGYTRHNIRISDKEDNVSLSDILIGEVWLCGGQSNMEMPLDGFGACPVEGSAETIARSGEFRDRIRDVKIPKTGAETPQDTVSGKWRVSSPENAKDFSAVGWFFASMLNAVLDVPVGLVECNWGGSAVESWLPKEVVYSYPENTIVDGKYSPGKLPQGWYYHTTPIVMYNGMIYPVRNYTLKGFLWYQGETNAGMPQYYAGRLAKMVEVWRNLWGDDNMPFYEVELAPFIYGGDGTAGARMREVQHNAIKIIKESGIVCTNDLVYPYEYDQIHPCRKKEVGERLAYMALNKTYGQGTIPCEGPLFREMSITGNVIEVSFYNDEMGLSPWHNITGFEVAGEDRVFHPAEARLSQWKDKVIVSSPEVPAPVAVRYCFRDFQPGNLTGRRNLPAVPFRSDNW